MESGTPAVGPTPRITAPTRVTGLSLADTTTSSRIGRPRPSPPHRSSRSSRSPVRCARRRSRESGMGSTTPEPQRGSTTKPRVSEAAEPSNVPWVTGQPTAAPTLQGLYRRPGFFDRTVRVGVHGLADEFARATVRGNAGDGTAEARRRGEVRTSSCVLSASRRLAGQSVVSTGPIVNTVARRGDSARLVWHCLLVGSGDAGLDHALGSLSSAQGFHRLRRRVCTAAWSLAEPHERLKHARDRWPAYRLRPALRPRL